MKNETQEKKFNQNPKPFHKSIIFQETEAVNT